MNTFTRQEDGSYTDGDTTFFSIKELIDAGLVEKAKINKFLYGWKFYVNYGQGWEYETFEETRAGMITNRKAYRENCSWPLKITKGRESNSDWEALHGTSK